MSDWPAPREKYTADLSIPYTKLQREVLEGEHVVLRPWEDSFADPVFQHLGGKDRLHLWEYTDAGPFEAVEELRSALHCYSDDTIDDRMWAVFPRAGGECEGVVIMTAIRDQYRVGEAGATYGSALQRTVASTEAIYLIMKKAFESGFRRVEWKCDAANLASKRAALRYGYRLEGIFRQHMIIRGFNRDTELYAMLDSEWPERKAALEAWMNPDNFDADGKQKKSLQRLQEAHHGN